MVILAVEAGLQRGTLIMQPAEPAVSQHSSRAGSDSKRAANARSPRSVHSAPTLAELEAISRRLGSLEDAICPLSER